MLVLALIYRRRIAGNNPEVRIARSQRGDESLVAPHFDIWNLRQKNAVWASLRHPRRGDPCDGVDGVVRYDHLSWRVVERRSNERRSGSGLTRHSLQPSLEQYLAVVRYSAGKNPMPLLQLLGVLIGAGILLWMVNRFIPMAAFNFQRRRSYLRGFLARKCLDLKVHRLPGFQIREPDRRGGPYKENLVCCGGLPSCGDFPHHFRTGHIGW